MTTTIEFKETVIEYTKTDIERLKALLDCNRGLISAALEIALSENLFASTPLDLRCVFIVEQCEKGCVWQKEHKEIVRQFTFDRTIQ